MAENREIVLKVEHLSKSYGAIKAVDDLSFDVYRGEVMGFLGPNGAGKTTAIQMMCGLLRSDQGEIEINGRSLRSGSMKGLLSIGVCPQQIVIWETLTCLEQLEFMGRMYGLGKEKARSRGVELLAAFALMEKRHSLGKTLSGGMQRRLNIALGLVQEPEILFLDEPQAGLDPQSRVLVRDYIKSLAGRMTVVLTTHDMEEAEKLSDRVSIIDHGQLLVQGPVAAIKNSHGWSETIEIEIAEESREQLLSCVPERLEDACHIAILDRTLQLTGAGALAVLTDILQVIKMRGLTLINVRSRQKTLEDVFIELTGRRLRE